MARGTVRITQDQKGLASLKKRIDTLTPDKSTVIVGLLGDGKKNPRRDESRLTNAALGIIHEFGTSKIPARPFLRPTVNANANRYQKALEAIVKQALETGTSPKRGLGLLGQAAVADIRGAITQGPPIPPPNAEATRARKESKRRKGSTGQVRTLVDTGRLVGALTYKVLDGAEAAKRGRK
jgi:hypothetical protein